MARSATGRAGDAVEGAYAPNERLTHGELADRLGAGRMSVRQALHWLEADGLVISTPNRGVRVAAGDRMPDFQVAHRDFHMVAAADYSSPFIADLVVRVHRHLFRQQQAYMSRPRVF